jgi:hypothetical protein
MRKVVFLTLLTACSFNASGKIDIPPGAVDVDIAQDASVIVGSNNQGTVSVDGGFLGTSPASDSSIQQSPQDGGAYTQPQNKSSLTNFVQGVFAGDYACDSNSYLQRVNDKWQLANIRCINNTSFDEFQATTCIADANTPGNAQFICNNDVRLSCNFYTVGSQPSTYLGVSGNLSFAA